MLRLLFYKAKKTLASGFASLVGLAVMPLVVWNFQFMYAAPPQFLAHRATEPNHAAVAEPSPARPTAAEPSPDDRIRVRWRTAYDEVPYAIIRRGSTSMELGTERVVRRGEVGREETVFADNYLDGKLIGSDAVLHRLVKPPVNEVTVYGTGDTISRGGKTLRFRKVLYLRATAYTPGKESNPAGDGLTATGLPARRGVVAVDPAVIPLGSRVYVDGYGYAVAADTGGAIRGHRIDLCMDSVAEAMDFGIQTVKVYLLE